VDTPEPAGRDRPAEPFADEARALTQELAAGGSVTLTLEPHRTRGSFGRLLAHVELPDGSSLNEALLAAGLARADDRWPHALVSRYARLQRAARREGLGLWSPPPTTDG
jgi:endonuclease YncB( thermonuclease family)